MVRWSGFGGGTEMRYGLSTHFYRPLYVEGIGEVPQEKWIQLTEGLGRELTREEVSTLARVLKQGREPTQEELSTLGKIWKLWTFGLVDTKKKEVPIITREEAIHRPGFFMPSSFGGWKTGEICQWIERQKEKGFSEEYVLGTLRGALTPESYADVLATYHHPLEKWEETVPVGSYDVRYPPAVGPADETVKTVHKVTEKVTDLSKSLGMENYMELFLVGIIVITVVIVLARLIK